MARPSFNAAWAAFMAVRVPVLEVRELADRYAKRVYGGAAQSEFNTMKCIDLLHSKELDVLAARLAKAR